jgi:hypothetical protein
LFKKEIEIEEISVKGATVDTRDLLDGLLVKGHLGELFLESHGVMFSPETARINEFSVKNTDLSVTLEEWERDYGFTYDCLMKILTHHLTEQT